MIRRNRRKIVFGISMALALCLLMPAFPVLAQTQKAGKTNTRLERLTPQEIDSQVAGMTDEQIRQAYAEKLKQDAAARTGSAAQTSGRRTWLEVSAKFYDAARSAKGGLKRAGGIFSGEMETQGRWQDAVVKLTDGNGAGRLLLTLTGLRVKWTCPTTCR